MRGHDPHLALAVLHLALDLRRRGREIGEEGVEAGLARLLLGEREVEKGVDHLAGIAPEPGGQRRAAALGAEKLVYLTDVEGLYADLADPGSLLEQLTVDEVEAILVGGQVSSGMVPKLTGIVTALRGGVRRAHILDGRREHALLLELFTDSGVGTMVQAEEEL